MMAAFAHGYFTPPYYFGDYSHYKLICKEDCLYPTCPFYSKVNMEERRHNHREDYDEWVTKWYKK